jgi:hypothetical protein
MVEDFLRISGVFISKVTANVLGNDLHVSQIDEIEAKVESSGESFVEILLGHLGENNDFADDGEEGFC